MKKRNYLTIAFLSFFCIIALLSIFSFGNLPTEKASPFEVTFTASHDQSSQKYMVILPNKFNSKKEHDLLIGLHGHGCDMKQYIFDRLSECRAFRDFASKQKMIAVSADYRPKTSWMGPAAEADLVQIIMELKQKYRIRKVYLTGASMGATATLTFCVLHPELIDGAAAMNPHANHLEYDNFQDAIAASFGGSKTDKKAVSEYVKRSAEFFPERITMPLAITVGLNDKIIPPASAIRLAEKIRKQGGKVFLIVREQGGHSTSYEDATAALKFMFSGKVLEKWHNIDIYK